MNNTTKARNIHGRRNRPPLKLLDAMSRPKRDKYLRSIITSLGTRDNNTRSRQKDSEYSEESRAVDKFRLLTLDSSAEDVSMHSPSDSSPSDVSMHSPSTLRSDNGSAASPSSDEPRILTPSSSRDSSHEPPVLTPSSSGDSSSSDIPESEERHKDSTESVVELKEHPDGSPGVCRLIVDCIMPNGDIRVSEPGSMLVTSKAYIVPRSQYPHQSIILQEAGYQTTPKRPGADLSDQNIFHLKIKNIAVSNDGSVTIRAALPGERGWSLWHRRDFRAAFGKSKTDMVLNAHRELAGQPKLPSKSSKSEYSIEEVAHSQQLNAYRERLLKTPLGPMHH